MDRPHHRRGGGVRCRVDARRRPGDRRPAVRHGRTDTAVRARPALDDRHLLRLRRAVRRGTGPRPVAGDAGRRHLSPDHGDDLLGTGRDPRAERSRPGRRRTDRRRDAGRRRTGAALHRDPGAQAGGRSGSARRGPRRHRRGPPGHGAAGRDVGFQPVPGLRDGQRIRVRHRGPVRRERRRPASRGIHAMAMAYHWSEAEILSLPRERRHAYLALIDTETGTMR